MKPYKRSELEFDVLYADGTKKHVKNGILFEETEEHTLDMHLGTDNQLHMFEAIVKTVLEILEQIADIAERMER
ncbi:MAG: hypothetical protein MJ117_04325 [Lachnospiraceae bacterium]|nr:hypothetical protein [Lachnospiraceae bacterium]